jgi:hypothetical protein
MEIATKFHDKQKLDMSLTIRTQLFAERALLARLAEVLSGGATYIQIVKVIKGIRGNEEWSVEGHKTL